MADRYNDSELAKLKTEEFTFNANIKGNFPIHSYPSPQWETLRKKMHRWCLSKNDPSIGPILLQWQDWTHHEYIDDRIKEDAAEKKVISEVQPQEWESHSNT